MQTKNRITEYLDDFDTDRQEFIYPLGFTDTPVTVYIVRDKPPIRRKLARIIAVPLAYLIAGAFVGFCVVYDWINE